MFLSQLKLKPLSHGLFHTPFIFMFGSCERQWGGLQDVSRRSPPTSQLCRQHQRWPRGGSTSLARREVWNREDVSCERAAGEGDVETSNSVNMQRLAETLERQLWTEEAVSSATPLMPREEEEEEEFPRPGAELVGGWGWPPQGGGIIWH